MKRIKRIVIMAWFLCMIFTSAISQPEVNAETVSVTLYDTPILGIQPVVEVKTLELTHPTLSQNDISLIALVTMAEAESEVEYGKRLVIDTILNRIESEAFPDSAYEVIYQKSQFTSVWNGRIDKCYVREDICKLVEEELVCRTNSDVVFFNAGHYSEYGEPVFSVGNHYFSILN